MIHKDIDPKNIIKGKDGKFKFTDFGISKTYDDKDSYVTFGGKKHYMAPEFYDIYQ